MSINNNGKPPQAPGARPGPQVNAKAAAPKIAKAAATKTESADAKEQFPDGFESEGALSRSFADGGEVHTASGVRSSGVRQMAKVLKKTLAVLQQDIADLSLEASPLLAELVAGSFSDDALSATSDKRKQRRDKLNALRRREISLRRRLRVMGSDVPMRDPVSKDDVTTLMAQIEDRKGGKTVAKDQARDALRMGSVSNNALRLPVVAGARGSEKAGALAHVLPGLTATKFLADLLANGPRQSALNVDTATKDAGHDDVLARYRLLAQCMETAA